MSEGANKLTSDRANVRGMTRKVSMNTRATKLNCANNDRVGEKVKEANGAKERCERAHERTSARVHERISERAHKCMSERANERMSERASRRMSKRAHVRTSERAK